MGFEKLRTESPIISVIMPAYNMDAFIETAIHSVMVQTVRDWELLVVDDCSTDETVPVVKRLAEEDDRIRLIQNEHNIGVARSRDKAVAMASGSYIAFLDSDDLWLPEKLERQLEKMQDEQVGIVYTSYEIVDTYGEKVKGDYIVPAETDYEYMLRQNCIGCSTVLIRSALMRKYCFHVGFYHEDYVLWLRILRDGAKAVGCTEPLTKWRYMENSRSFNKYQAARNRWRIYRQYLKLPFGKSVRSFLCYAAGGVNKYFLSGKK